MTFVRALEGVRLNQQGKYDSASVIFGKLLEREEGREWEGGRVFVNLANSFFYREEYVEALKYYFEALRYAWLIKSAIDRTRPLVNIAECYYQIGSQSQALYYANWADSLLMNTPGEELCYLRAQALYVAGAVLLDNGEYDEAEKKMQGTLYISEYINALSLEAGMLWYKAYGEEGLSKIRLARNHLREAEQFALQSIETAHRFGDPNVKAKCLLALSNVYLQQERYEPCRRVALEATSISPDAIRLYPDLAYNLAVANMRLGETATADTFLRTYSKQMKKNTDRNFREIIAGMDVQYNIERKQLRIATLERERLLYVSLIILGCLSTFSLALYQRQRLKRHRQEKSLAEIRAATQGILEGETNERERIASDLHDGIQGQLTVLKLTLNSDDKAQALIDKALEELHNMSRILSSRVLDKYGLNVAIDDYCRMFPNVAYLFFGAERRVSKHVETLLYRCVQELVTNSVKHAAACSINVHLIQQPARILLIVFDDGHGFDPATVRKGMGLSSIRHRLEAIDGKLDIASSPVNGTETTIDVRI